MSGFVRVAFCSILLGIGSALAFAADDAVVGLTHSGLRVNDLERATRFYTEVFGFTAGQEYVSGKGRSKMSRMIALGHSELELIYDADQRLALPAAGPPHTGLYHLSFDVREIEPVAQRILRAGGTIDQGTAVTVDYEHGGARIGLLPGESVQIVWGTDSEGTPIELVTHVPRLRR